MYFIDKQVRLLLFIMFALSFFSFGWISHNAYTPSIDKNSPSLLDKIKRTKSLNVVLLNAPTTYYVGSEGAKGFEYDLLNAYAKHLKVNLNVIPVETIKEALELSKKPEIHIVSASIAKTPKKQKEYNFGPSYFEVQEQLICHRGMIGSGKFPRSVEQLAGLKITVGEDTSYSETIRTLQNEGFDINASFTSEYSTEELLEQVASHQIDCTIANSNIYSLNLRYMTEIALAFTISGREQLAWILAENSDKLKADMYSWLNTYVQTGSMDELKDHYYSYILYFSYYDTTMFYKRIKSRLPKYEKYFKQASKRYDIPWKLIAAISYQESHWNEKARSYTGVRGLMMLTKNTAKMLKIKNRLNPKQSVMGGVRHLKQMLKNVPEEVQGENRLKFALAAYNVGMGHIKDAQKLAIKLGYDQNIWSDLKKVLPLLSQKRYYRTLKYGYARGSEPVRYVDSIYDYRDILQNLDQEKQEAKKSDTNTSKNIINTTKKSNL